MRPARTRSSASWKIVDSARSRITSASSPRGERLFLNRRGGKSEIAEDGFFFDDAGVVLDVGDARQAVRQLRKIRNAAGGFEFAAAGEVFHQRDDVDGLLLFGELDHALENLAMLREEEILGAQLFDGGVQADYREGRRRGCCVRLRDCAEAGVRWWCRSSHSLYFRLCLFGMQEAGFGGAWSPGIFLELASAAKAAFSSCTFGTAEAVP